MVHTCRLKIHTVNAFSGTVLVHTDGPDLTPCKASPKNTILCILSIYSFIRPFHPKLDFYYQGARTFSVSGLVVFTLPLVACNNHYYLI
jgi:hypothetical protein